MFRARQIIAVLAVFAASSVAQEYTDYQDYNLPDCVSDCTDEYWGSTGYTICEDMTTECVCTSLRWTVGYSCCIGSSTCSDADKKMIKKHVSWGCRNYVDGAGDACDISGLDLEDNEISSSTTKSSSRVSSSTSSSSDEATPLATQPPWTPQAAVATPSSDTSAAVAIEEKAKSSPSELSAPVSVGVGIGVPIIAFVLAALAFGLYGCLRRPDRAMGTEDHMGLMAPVEYGGKRIAVVRSLIGKS